MHKIFSFVILAAVFYLGFSWTQKLLTRFFQPTITNTITQKVGCDEDCRTEIQKEVQKAIGGSSPVPVIRNITTNSTSQKQTQFISLDNTFSTTSTGWVDVPGTDVAFDIEKNYAKGAKVDWQASLKVADANGQAFARLFDTTHGIAVSGSEISTVNNSDYKTVYSGQLNLWSGHINYRVQIKSLNSFNISYTGGKIRIEY